MVGMIVEDVLVYLKIISISIGDDVFMYIFEIVCIVSIFVIFYVILNDVDL